MRLATVLSVPGEYSRFGRVIDEFGTGYTVDPTEMPEDIDVDDDVAYRVEIWGNDSGLAYDLVED